MLYNLFFLDHGMILLRGSQKGLTYYNIIQDLAMHNRNVN